MGLGGELAEGLLGEFDPSIDGGAAAAEEAGDIIGGFALRDEFDGAEAATLEFFGGPDRSHTISTSGTVGLFG